MKTRGSLAKKMAGLFFLLAWACRFIQGCSRYWFINSFEGRALLFKKGCKRVQPLFYWNSEKESAPSLFVWSKPNFPMMRLHDIFCNISCHIGPGSILLVWNFSGKCSTTMTTHSTISIYNNFSSGYSGIPLWSANNKGSCFINKIFCIFI